MATIIVATSSPPFAEGGHLVMARELVRALEECGHQAALRGHAAEPLRPAGAAPTSRRGAPTSRVAHEGRRVDQVISLRFPAYAVRHERHVVWLNHRMREYYDLWDQFSRSCRGRTRIKERRAAR